MRIFFIRHAESIKSVEDRHGGGGHPLTLQGKEDVLDLIDWLINVEKIEIESCMLFCSNLTQVKETGAIISSKLNIPISIDDRLKNIYLGILDGLSTKEAETKYPNVANRLTLWREQKLSIEEVNIPQSESLKQFYDRIYEFLEELFLSKVEDVVIVGTRSVGVAITNIIKSRLSSFDGKKYVRYNFDPGSASLYYISKIKSSVIYLNTTSYLKNKPNFPDK
ncbi:histidine phosphatase family protein [Candidatus Pacearchaeota archaeon]|nr:histidine phosphatase family protein [Candidatus Pacearchaeota archaeon]